MLKIFKGVKACCLVLVSSLVMAQQQNNNMFDDAVNDAKKQYHANVAARKTIMATADAAVKAESQAKVAAQVVAKAKTEADKTVAAILARSRADEAVAAENNALSQKIS